MASDVPVRWDGEIAGWTRSFIHDDGSVLFVTQYNNSTGPSKQDLEEAYTMNEPPKYGIGNLEFLKEGN